MADFERESMLEMFTFEMSQLLEQLEQSIIQGESGYTMDKINEIFRIMHTIKGSSAMMMFNSISTAAHAIEDLFYYLREENPPYTDASTITDLVLESLDFVKEEISKIEGGLPSDGDPAEIIQRIKAYLTEIKAQNGASSPAAGSEAAKTGKTAGSGELSALPQKPGLHAYTAKIYFDEGCEMENVRALAIVNNLTEMATDIEHFPENILEEASIEDIRQNGFQLAFYSEKDYQEIHKHLEGTIYLKTLELVEGGEPDSGSGSNVFEVVLHFDDGCEMENVRAFTVVHNLKNMKCSVKHVPEDLIDEAAIESIRKNGLYMTVTTKYTFDELNDLLSETIFLKDLQLEQVSAAGASNPVQSPPASVPVSSEAIAASAETSMTAPAGENAQTASQADAADSPAKATQDQAQAQSAAKKAGGGQHVISVNVSKLDQLLKLMGELVISEAMVTQNPELEGLELDSFLKEARQLRKIIKDIQDTVMSMRMVPLSTTFFKMHRIVRDMCKQLGKDIHLEIVGEDTEVDKNIIEHISDPLMHIIRNSADHGIEMPDVRQSKGKPKQGTILLEAKNSGGDVLIIIKDDGAGLNKEKILQKAKNNGLLKKPENEYSDKEIYPFIFMPGFSTNEKVTTYSGRGVGMDVVSQNLEMVGGTVIVDSIPGEGSTFTLKIPLTLAIIEGMMVTMGGAKYTLPIISIRDSFKPLMKDVFTDPNGNEMITVRDECYNIVRLYEFFGIDHAVKDLEEGIMIMVENGDDTICLFVDELVGEQQVVVKSMPKYIKRIRGISGCTLLGNGDISLIIDVAGFFDK